MTGIVISEVTPEQAARLGFESWVRKVLLGGREGSRNPLLIDRWWREGDYFYEDTQALWCAWRDRFVGGKDQRA